jgi:hypothetical protein
MYLFSRRARLVNGGGRDALAWATGITETANRITGLPISLFAQVYSPAFGTVSWTAFVPDLTALEAAGDKLAIDDEYADQSDAGAKFTDGGMDDTVFQVVHGEPDPNREVNYVGAVRAVCANGHLARGMAVGVEIAQRAEAITGTPCMFLADTTGVYGGVAWLSGYADVAALEAAQQAEFGNSDFVDFLDREAGPAYAADSSLTTQVIHRRLV